VDVTIKKWLKKGPKRSLEKKRGEWSKDTPRARGKVTHEMGEKKNSQTQDTMKERVKRSWSEWPVS